MAGCGIKEANSAKPAVPESQKAKDFTLTLLDGKTFSLSSLIGKKAVLLDFTTTWCPHCINIIPSMKDIYANYKNRGLEVTAIYVNEKRADVEEFSRKQSIPYMVLLDPDGAVASDYGIMGVPTIVVIDKSGTIRYKGYTIPKEVIEEVAVR
jgi:peroxiredoxin